MVKVWPQHTWLPFVTTHAVFVVQMMLDRPSNSNGTSATYISVSRCHEGIRPTRRLYPFVATHYACGYDAQLMTRPILHEC